jgi:hypothetical protein
MIRALAAGCLLIVACGVPLCNAQWTQSPFAPDTAKLERADLTEVLGLLCPGQEYVGQESGCRVCPATSKRAGARADASIVAAVRGHFLKPDSDDLLLDLIGCGPALLTRSSSGWFVNRAEALPDGPCRKIQRRDGRDGLLCYEASVSADREDARISFSVLPDQKTDLAVALDNTGGACDSPKPMVVQSAIQPVVLKVSISGGARLTMTVSLRCRRGPLSERSRKACARGSGFEDIGPVARFRTFPLEYAFNGNTFSLAPASKPVKQAYDACAASPP